MIIEPDDPRGPIWTTLGVIIALGLSAVGWVLLATLISWPGAVALLVITMVIWILLELRHHRR